MNNFLVHICYSYFLFLFPIVILFALYCFRNIADKKKIGSKILVITSIFFVPAMVIFYMLLSDQGYMVLAAGVNGIFLALLYCGLAYNLGRVISWRVSLFFVFLIWLNSYLALMCGYTAFDVIRLFQTASLNLDIGLLTFMAKVIALLILSELCRNIIQKIFFVHNNDDRINIQKGILTEQIEK